MTKKQILEEIKNQIETYKNKAELASKVTTDNVGKTVTEAIIIMTKKLLDFIDVLEVMDEPDDINIEDALADFIIDSMNDDNSNTEDILKLAKYFYNLGAESGINID